MRCVGEEMVQHVRLHLLGGSFEAGESVFGDKEGMC